MWDKRWAYGWWVAKLGENQASWALAKCQAIFQKQNIVSVKFNVALWCPAYVSENITATFSLATGVYTN